MYLLIVVIASYSKSEYHASDSVAGLVVGLFIVGSLIGRFVTGKYVNRFKKFSFWFNMFSSNTATLFYTWFCLVLNLMVRLLNGLATAVATLPTGTIAAYITHHLHAKSEGISLFSLSLVLGTAIGPFLVCY